MSLTFGSAVWLWAFALMPLVWLLAGRGRFADRRARRWLLTGVRALLLSCLIGALAQPILSLPATRVTLVHLVDASHSVSARALTSAADAIDRVSAALRPEDVRILVFAGRSSVVADTAALRALAEPAAAQGLMARVGPEVTNLEQALSAARAEIPAGTNGRILVWSDGRETEGDSRRMAGRLAAERVPVFTHAVPVRAVGDTWIAEVRTVGAPVAHAPAQVEVIVGSDIARPAEVTLRENGRLLGRAAVALVIGETAVPIDVSIETPGPHLLEARVESTGDVLAANNTLSKEVRVEPRPRVLYVHDDGGNAGVTEIALAEAGLEMTRVRPQALPTRPDAYTRWDVVVLSNIPRGRISTAAMEGIGRWVEDYGGGLLFAGGAAVVGDEAQTGGNGGYRETEIERLLPVTFEREDEPEVALVIVLDRSWSMNGEAMELSKTAAEAAASTLAPPQLVGILTFNNDSNWDVPLARVRDVKAGLHEAIGRITASGPTAIYPAMERAHETLAAARARAKHVILLSDGQTAPADFEGLIRKMSAANITVSSVALGSEADATLLSDIAKWGGGRSYVVHDAKQVPEIFVTEAKNASTPGFDDAASIESTVGLGGWLPAAASRVPPLRGRNVVTRKPQAIDVLSTAKGEPLLALWPAGLGRTAMFAADLDGRWTSEWLKWRGFGGFVATVVRSLAPQRRAARALEVVSGDGEGTTRSLAIVLEARDALGRRENLLSPTVQVHRPGGADVSIPLPQVAPGRYAAHVASDVSEPLVFSASTGGAEATRMLAFDAFAEYRFADADAARLEALATMTGGVMAPTPEVIQAAPRTAGATRRPLGPWLLGFALLLWPMDIGLRRLT